MKSRAVIQAMVVCRRDNASNVHLIHELSNRASNAYEATRARAANFSMRGAWTGNYFHARGTTESINLVAASWASQNLKAGDRILLHRNGAPQREISCLGSLCERIGTKLSYLPVTGGEGLLDFR